MSSAYVTRTPGLDPADLRPLPGPVPTGRRDPLGFPGYPEKLARAGTSSGADESVSIGTAELGGQEVVVALGRFGFLGGSMGVVHGDRVLRAMDHAASARLPFVAVTRSGGARMQEGMVALTQLSRASEGVRRLRELGVPVLAHLRHPTTGGVHASYGALAEVAVADRAATVGFAGPRVVEAVTGAVPGPDSHTAEAALTNGLIDELVDRDAREVLTAWVSLLHPGARHGLLPTTRLPAEPDTRLAAWDAVRRARHPERPTARQLLTELFDGHRELRGDRAGEDDPVAVTALARLGARRVMVVGTDRLARAAGPGRRTGQATAAGYRKLRRAAELADRWQLPLIGLIDTVGADPSPASDVAGLTGAIAETFVATLSVSAPTIGVVTGEGGSGGALAIGCTDRLLMQDDAVFEVIAPEGAAAIVYRDRDRAAEVAPLLKPTAAELRELGITDRVLPGPTTTSPTAATAALRAALGATLAELDADPDRLGARRARYGPVAQG